MALHYVSTLQYLPSLGINATHRSTLSEAIPFLYCFVSGVALHSFPSLFRARGNS